MKTTLKTNIDTVHVPVKPFFRSDNIRLTVEHNKGVYNAMPVLEVLLEDFHRPEEFVKWLKQLLEADISSYKMEETPLDEAFESRRYFVKQLIKAIKKGLVHPA